MNEKIIWKQRKILLSIITFQCIYNFVVILLLIQIYITLFVFSFFFHKLNHFQNLFGSNAIFHFLLLITISFLLLLLPSFTFLLHLRFRFIYVSTSFMFLLLISFTFSIWIYGRLNCENLLIFMEQFWVVFMLDFLELRIWMRRP